MTIPHFYQVFSNEKTQKLKARKAPSSRSSQLLQWLPRLWPSQSPGSPFLQVWKRTDRVGARRISGLLFHPGNIPIYIYIYVGYEGHLRIIFPKIPGTSKQHGFFVAREGTLDPGWWFTTFIWEPHLPPPHHGGVKKLSLKRPCRKLMLILLIIFNSQEEKGY